MRAAAVFLSALALLGGCKAREAGPYRVSVIGTRPMPANPNNGRLAASVHVLNGAVMQGLVALNAQGEVVPALAESWTPTSDGLSLIFRIGDVRWPDGRPVKAVDVVQSLKASMAPGSRNPLRGLFQSVTEIIPQTDRVLEIRLAAPQPFLVQLLAQPEMAIIRDGKGSGPFEINLTTEKAHILWRRVPKGLEKDISESDRKKSEIRLWGEGAATALSRIKSRDSRLLLGGTYEHVPFLGAADLPSNVIRRDPVQGLFGLVFAQGTSLLTSADVRKALAMAVDRQALISLFDPIGMSARETVLPVPINKGGTQARPAWMALDRLARIARARDIIATKSIGARILTIALPKSPGARLLFAQLQADWARIGIRLNQATNGSSPDVELVDAVAPYNGAGWYFGRLSCTQGIQCSLDADAALSRARKATTEDDRMLALQEADEFLTEAQIYLPLGQPIRWSVADPKLTGFRENAFAIHNLDSLRPQLRD